MEPCPNCKTPFCQGTGDACPTCGCQTSVKIQGYEPPSISTAALEGSSAVSPATLENYRELLIECRFPPDIVENAMSWFTRIKPFTSNRAEPLRQVLAVCVELGGYNANVQLRRDQIAKRLNCKNSGKGRAHVLKLIEEKPELFNGMSIPELDSITSHADIYTTCMNVGLSADDCMRTLILYKRLTKDKFFRRLAHKTCIAGAVYIVVSNGDYGLTKQKIADKCDVSATTIGNFMQCMGKYVVGAEGLAIQGLLYPLEDHGLKEKEYKKAYEWLKTLSESGVKTMLHERIGLSLWEERLQM